jgi:hypothetical protein
MPHTYTKIVKTSPTLHSIGVYLDIRIPESGCFTREKWISSDVVGRKYGDPYGIHTD